MPSDPEIALRNTSAGSKHKVIRPEIKVGDMVRIRVKPIESRGSYRVNKIAWSDIQGPPRAGRFDGTVTFQAAGAGGAGPASGGYREGPGSHLPFKTLFSMPLRLYIRQLRQHLLTIFHCPRPITVKPGQALPLGAPWQPFQKRSLPLSELLQVPEALFKVFNFCLQVL